MVNSVLVVAAFFLFGSNGNIHINFANITNPSINPYVFGMNMYTQDSNGVYTGNYTIIRNGGEAQTRYNWEINSINANHDWYFITQQTPKTWQENSDPVVYTYGMDLLTQIPMMGWVGKGDTKSWSFSQSKYGKQQKNECTGQPNGTTWCASDAGNGVWVNGSDVVGNDPNDADVTTTPQDAYNWVKAIVDRYQTSRATIFELDNEVTIWHSTHRDVHPIGSTYDELWNKTFNYGRAIKAACNNDCLIMGLSTCCYCGYFTSGYDHQNGNNGCFTGPDRESHGNLTLLQWFLMKSAQYEKEYGQRLVDILDVHYYPATNKNGVDISFNCDESESTASYRLQAPRALYDWTYVDPSWINEPVALIPRLKQWINDYYPGTGLSITEFNFGGDDCITSINAHSEVLAICASFGVTLATRWSKPQPNSFFGDAYKIFLNYDLNGGSILPLKGTNGRTYAIETTTDNIERITGYSFIKSVENKNTLYIYLYNKEPSTTAIDVILGQENNNQFNTNGVIKLYGIDGPANGQTLRFIGNVTTKSNNFTFSVNLPAYSIRLAIVNQN